VLKPAGPGLPCPGPSERSDPARALPAGCGRVTLTPSSRPAARAHGVRQDATRESGCSGKVLPYRASGTHCRPRLASSLNGGGTIPGTPKHRRGRARLEVRVGLARGGACDLRSRVTAGWLLQREGRRVTERDDGALRKSALPVDAPPRQYDREATTARATSATATTAMATALMATTLMAMTAVATGATATDATATTVMATTAKATTARVSTARASTSTREPHAIPTATTSRATIARASTKKATTETATTVMATTAKATTAGISTTRASTSLRELPTTARATTVKVMTALVSTVMGSADRRPHWG
jgi:hypothetical protein